MEALQALSALAFLVVMTVLGLRLLVLAARHRQMPELLLGLSFLLGGSLGAAVEAGSMAAAGRIDHAGALLGIGKLFGLTGILANCAFTWWVFRRHDPRGLVAMGGVMLLVTAGFLGHLASGAFEGGAIRSEWFLLELTGRLASPAWLGLEAFWYWRALRRRAALGLAEPVLVNRMLLWTVASATGVLCLLTSVPPRFLGPAHPILAFDMLVFAVTGIATATAYGLAFFPPEAYRRWIEGRAAVASAAKA